MSVMGVNKYKCRDKNSFDAISSCQQHLPKSRRIHNLFYQKVQADPTAKMDNEAPPEYREVDASGFSLFRAFHCLVHGPAPPPYDASTRVDPSGVLVATEAPTPSFEPCPIDSVLGVQLMLQLIRCLRAITVLDNRNRFRPDDFLRMADLLERNLGAVRVQEHGRGKATRMEKELAKCIRVAVPRIRQWGTLLMDAQITPELTEEDVDEFNFELYVPIGSLYLLFGFK